MNNASLGMHAGKTYPFHLALSNPLYDQITVRLSVQRIHISTAPVKEGSSPEKARRPPFAISLPNSSFPVSAYAEAWEYEDDEDMFGADQDDDLLGRSSRETDSRGKVRTVGVLEKRANVTLVGGEVVIGKEARGNVKVCLLDAFGSDPSLTNTQFNMLVTYTYHSDDPAPSESNEAEPSKAASKTASEVKTFAFYTVVDLGHIIPREEVKADLDL